MARDLPGSRVRRRRVRRLCAFLLLLSGLALLLGLGGAYAQIAGSSPRVLILYPYDERLPATTILGEVARTRLLEATAGKIDLFSEFLDLSRFPERPHMDRMARYLSEKYAAHRPDVIIALGEGAASFIVAHRGSIAPDAKVIFCGFGGEEVSGLRLPDDVSTAFSEFDIAKTLEIARRLQPNARHLYVLGGSAAFDKAWLKTARQHLADAEKNYETTYLENLSIEEFADHASKVPSDSIIIVLTIFADSAGRNFLPKDAVEIIAARASAPVYGPYNTYVGHGVVGGNTVTFESIGRTAAGMVVDTLAGKPISDVDVPQTYFADARQMKRWGLSESALPPGTTLHFKEPTLWEEHWPSILTVFAVVAMQGMVIAFLLLERRRRFAAEGEARLRLLELVHLNQSATAGALSASIAHELNQPLGAILSNAEAAEAILRGKTPDLDLIRQILVDIREDDQRAGGIIQRQRVLLKKRTEIDWQEFDLNEVVASAIDILRAEAEKRNVVMVAGKSVRRMMVRADKVHVQQVILNLATNAMDAMLDSASDRRLTFQAVMNERDEVELSIADTGRGIPRDRLESIFNAFYTSKQTGTGLGLCIARAIVETYGGKIWADNRPQGGAVFRFTLPLAQDG